MRKISLFLLLIFPIKLFPTHLVGGEITYSCLGDNLYEIRVVIYRDCGPTNTNDTGFDNNAIITIYDGDNSFINELETGPPQTEIINDEFTNECLSIPSNLCIEKGTYTIITNLPTNNSGYQVVYQRCCRNEQVINIVNPNDFGSSLVAYIPSFFEQPCNNSPSFESFPPMALCLGIEMEISQSAFDLDGDELVYSFTAPYHGASDDDPTETYPPPYSQIIWEDGYSDQYPLSSDPAIQINPETGLITGIPNQEGFYIVGVKVEEYRNGIFIGEIIRDFRFLVIDCEIATASVPIADIYCEGLTVNFQNQSLNSFDYFWDFGDLTTLNDSSNEIEPSYIYPDSGSYQVTLIANPNTYCSDTSEVFFSLYPDLYPYFSSPLMECDINASYNFFGSGIIPPNAEFLWDFGQNSSTQFSNLLNPTNIQFNSLGSNIVTFSVSYLECQETYSQELTVLGEELVSISSNQNNVCESNSISLFSNVTGNAEDYSYNWNFGNNITSNDQNPLVFFQPGSYDIYLQVVNNVSGCESSIQEDDFINVFSEPISIIQASESSGCSPLTVELYNLSENSTNYQWNLINLQSNQIITYSTNVTETLSHIFENGEFDVVLISYGDVNCPSDTSQIYINSSLPVSSNFEIDYICNNNLQISIANNSTNFDNVFWDFGDGNSSFQSINSYNYSNEGQYIVNLITENLNSCNLYDTLAQLVNVSYPPQSSFNFNSSVDCIEGLVEFVNTSIESPLDPILHWNWNFGDGLENNSINPSHNFSSQGNYLVTLNIITQNNCSSIFSDNISINIPPKPESKFSVYIDSCSKNIELINESENANDFFWNLGGGVVSYDENPNISLDFNQINKVDLISINNDCKDTLSQVFFIDSLDIYSEIEIPNIITPNNDYINDYFKIKGIRDCESPLLKVYNRWGNLVYYSIYPSIEPWDGFSNNNEVIEGTYFYILKLKYKTFKGVISVFR
ncbi:MAG: hypothetical protein CMD07_04220 [Flavobacteriales bacterium]|nr:hypothetical protein [Flavobacteriales bacterium]|tara:strand:- start:2225 stop:5116 length:2892 start_codon:yes stop_codon:yes gene_type:complete